MASKKLNNHEDRQHAVLSASSAHRWLACPPSAFAALAYEDTSSVYAEEGTLAHEVAEAVVSGLTVGKRSELEATGAVTDEMIRHAGEYRDYIDELKNGDDSVLLLEQKVDFSAWVPEGFGICDCILIQGDELIIVDYKYGAGVPVSALNNPQLRLYALGALNDYGFAYEVANVQMHIFQPRLGNISSETLTVDELLSWAASIAHTAAQAYKGKGKYSAGAHCKFCPHAGRCRSLAASCRELVDKPDLGITAQVPVLAPFEIAEILELEPMISLWLKRVKDQALETLLDGGEVPGFKAVEGRSNRSWNDEAHVASVLEAAGLDPSEYTETKLLSPAKLESSIGKKDAAALVGDLIVKNPGAPTLAPMSDKREPVTRLAEAQADFD